MKKEIVVCPKCGSEKTNQVTPNLRYCLDCCIEFSKTQVFTILYNGELADYQTNEFENCG